MRTTTLLTIIAVVLCAAQSVVAITCSSGETLCKTAHVAANGTLLNLEETCQTTCNECNSAFGGTCAVGETCCAKPGKYQYYEYCAEFCRCSGWLTVDEIDISTYTSSTDCPSQCSYCIKKGTQHFCVMNCQGTNCASATVQCPEWRPSGSYPIGCLIDCSGSGTSCQNIEVECAPYRRCIMNCTASGANTCRGMTVTAPGGTLFTANCAGGEHTCSDSDWNMEGSQSVHLTYNAVNAGANSYIYTGNTPTACTKITGHSTAGFHHWGVTDGQIPTCPAHIDGCDIKEGSAP
ncbi:hypothetical protein QOT17_016590 [Balamuthia mandrillaris]